MSNQKLPSYLHFETDGTVSKNKTVLCGDVRFTVITDRLIRIERGNFTDNATLTVISRNFADANFSVDKTDSELKIETKYLILRFKKDSEFSADNLSIRLKDKPYTEWHFGEKPLFNLGGTVSTLDCINGECPIDDGVCSIDGYAIIDDSKTPVFDDEGWFAVREKTEDYYFFGYGHDYTECVKDYYRLTGIPDMLPAFALGNWWSRYHRYSDVEYLELMDKFDEKDVPLSVGIVDMDWHITKMDTPDWDYWKDGWTGYTWDKEVFPNYKMFLEQLHARNLKTALNLHPADGIRNFDDMYEEMADAMGVDKKSGKVIPFDCLNPKFLKEYFEILHFPYEKNGVDFWWMDWQQGTDYWWIHRYDKTVNPLECIKPLWLLNHMHYLAQKRDGKRGFVFSRFAGYGSQRYPIGFSGDTIISWESLAFQVYFTATASNIGYSWWSHDIGGHARGIRDDELNARWIQFGVFSPIFRLHTTDDLFLGREPWNYGLECETVVEDFMRLRHKLFPYLYTMNYRNYSELLPLMRPMYHTNPEQKEAYSVPRQYWFGSELIVSPITEKGDDKSGFAKADVWLPDGIFVDWFTGFVYKGGKKFEAFRPLNQMPLFIKAGGIVPMQSHEKGDNTLGLKTDLEVTVAAGGNGSFTMFEDDGESTDYENGKFCKTPFTFSWGDKTAEFTIEKSEGDITVVPKLRNYKIKFIGFKKGCRFFFEDTELPAVYNQKTASYDVEVYAVSSKLGFKITVQNEDGLLFDNSDCRDRVIDTIIHAQYDLPTKNHILETFDKRFKQYKDKKDNDGKYENLTADCDTNLTKHMAELLTQVLYQMKED